MFSDVWQKVIILSDRLISLERGCSRVTDECCVSYAGDKLYYHGDVWLDFKLNQPVKSAYGDFWFCANSSTSDSRAWPFLEQRRRSIIADSIEGKVSVRTAVFFPCPSRQGLG